MKPVLAFFLVFMLPLPGVPVAQASDERPLSSRIEVRLETVVNRVDGGADSCAAAQVGSARPTPSFAFWTALGDAGITDHCGTGAFVGHTETPAAATPAPLLIQEIAALAGWEAGAMDPGPQDAVVIFVTVKTRHLTGHTKAGEPEYGAPVVDRRTMRLEPGEEYVVPVALDARERETLGVNEVLLRVRAGWAGREGATEYGVLTVREAAPGSEVILDGQVAARTGADGVSVLTVVPVGQHEVRIRGGTGAVVTRTVMVVKEREVAVTPEAADGGSARRPYETATSRNAEGYQEYRRERDGAIMVEIPEGEYVMGNLETEGAPQPHTVFVSTFLMDKLPLTVGLYRRFAEATGRPLPPDPYWGVHDDQPVAYVRWDEAKAYCEWAGARLPREAEREKAARGTDGRMFPWGNEPPSPERAVFGRYWGEAANDTVGIRPAGAGPYGLLDSEGNMWEFCEDWYDPDYYASSPLKDPPGAKTGRARVVRGGSWDSRWVALSASKRNFAYTGYREGDFGFRCAADPPR